MDIPGNLALVRVLVFWSFFDRPQTRMVKPKNGVIHRRVRARAESVVSPLSLSLASPLASGLFGAEKVVGVSGTEFRWGVLEDRMGRHRAMQTKKNPASPKACGVGR